MKFKENQRNSKKFFPFQRRASATPLSTALLSEVLSTLFISAPHAGHGGRRLRKVLRAKVVVEPSTESSSGQDVRPGLHVYMKFKIIQALVSERCFEGLQHVLRRSPPGRDVHVGFPVIEDFDLLLCLAIAGISKIRVTH